MRILSAFVVAAGALFATVDAASAMVCGQHEAIVKALDANFKEHQTTVGLTQSGALLEIYASTDGTWTMIVTTPKGAACILAAGDGWQQVPNGPEV